MNWTFNCNSNKDINTFEIVKCFLNYFFKDQFYRDGRGGIRVRRLTIKSWFRITFINYISGQNINFDKGIYYLKQSNKKIYEHKPVK